MSRYRFIRAEKAAYPVTVLCRVLGVARSGYYAWAGRGNSARAQADEELTAQISAAHARSRGTYGAPRVHAELRAAGTRCARKRVARLMRAAGLAGCHRRRRARTTVADPAHAPAPNLVAREFVARAPNRLWIGDITYVPTGEGWLYLAVLVDVYSRRVVGWAMADHLRAELALDALALALRTRRPGPGLVQHTDRGSQYTAAAYQQALAPRGLVCSMSRSGDCLDNAMAESFFATLKAELVELRHWATRAAARTAIFEWIEVFYNRQRAHSALAYLPPVTLEAELLLLSCPAA
ncbi:MAG: Mobile element protein [uncultured Gemmatimonadaceae bacterium]|uniref:Mobile element protein n=1 Tax=uncultured Gemmatimonadaceae bacterium TaxID=246130 RepID=A0A6J4KNS5_9BACT|nr:MAG: Mobile element protein [uncultured Gemmatimonadaceae bacterium]